MNQGQASRTALGVAALRAFHQRWDDEPKILHDPISARLLDPPVRSALEAYSGGPTSEAATALRCHVVLRSRYAEDRLAWAARRGLRQCVTLGAGLDTFAWRQPEWSHAFRLFEVDHPATQADKRQRLEAASLPVPDNLDFVPIDFEATSLAEGLAASQLDFSKPAFFTCLGVLVYLTEAAIDAIFDLVARFPPGSEIDFTISPPPGIPSAVAERAAAAGEPWRTHIDAAGLEGRLLRVGFSKVDWLDPEAAAVAYFPTIRGDGLTPARRTSLGAATVG